MYIYCHPQTDCFVVSQLFSVARHMKHSMDPCVGVYIYIYIYIYIHTYTHKGYSENLFISMYFTWKDTRSNLYVYIFACEEQEPAQYFVAEN